MSQHNRKDPRAKVLSMTVRYRSATLNEFIEHHSYDVSRGGLFIKTPSPFAPGTLLKFEVKIAEDQRVMQGVGRVVWKRDSSNGPEEPGGMGIKFIKLDDASKSVIERLVQSRGQHTVSAFDRSPDSRSVQMFPGLEESTISEDPTVVRSRSDVFPAETAQASPEGSAIMASIPAPPSGAGLTSIPVPSGPAVSVAGAAVSLPPLSLSPNSMGPSGSGAASNANALGSRGPMAQVSVPPRAPSSLGPRPRSGAPQAEAPYRKPGPVPVNSAPPPRSSSAYALLGLVAALVGGGFLYLKLTHNSQLTSAPAAVRPAAPVVPSPPPGAPSAAGAALPGELPAREPVPSDLDKAGEPSPDAAPSQPSTAEALAAVASSPAVDAGAASPGAAAALAPAVAIAKPKPSPKSSARKVESKSASSETAPSDSSASAPSAASESGTQPSAPAAPKEVAPAAAPAEAPPAAASDEEFR